MNTHFISFRLRPILLSSIVLVLILFDPALGQRRRLPPGGRIAIVVDERLSALRSTPDLSGKLLRRVGRGKLVAIRREKRSNDGIVFYQVNVTKRTGGWIQREALVSPNHAGDDERSLRLIKGSEDFDRIARARIFLDAFPRSPFRPVVLMLYAEEAESAASKLSRDAARRLNGMEVNAGSAPLFTYFLNYNGLDRYTRQGIMFVFAREEKKFHYDGAAWREIIRRYPRSPEAGEARKRLATSNIQNPER
jgi:hypothetical protein